MGLRIEANEEKRLKNTWWIKTNTLIFAPRKQSGSSLKR
jgi:hypothetical protein